MQAPGSLLCLYAPLCKVYFNVMGKMYFFSFLLFIFILPLLQRASEQA